MQVVIRSRHIELNDRLRDVATEKITRLTRYLDDMDHAEITFSEEKNPRIAKNEVCEVVLYGHGHHVRAKASAADSFAAVDLVVDKLAHQMEKLKGRLVLRHHARHSHHNGVDKAAIASTAVAAATAPAPEAENATEEARIIRRKQFAVTPMSAEDAALQMDLLQHDFYLFTNAETGRAAVVYRREDGHLGLIDAAE